MKNLYKLSIKYMLFFSLALLASGLWLFLLSSHREHRSIEHLLEVATPHLFAMGILVFTLAHFLLFSSKIKPKHALRLSQGLYLLMFLNIFVYFLTAIFYFKLLLLGAFMLLFLLLMLILWFSL